MRVKNYDTTLFNEKVTNNFKNNSLTVWDDRVDRCITYNSIIGEMTELGYITYMNELKYRLDNNENINEILMDIITKNQTLKSTLGYHKGVIQMYLDQDFMDLFK